MTSIQASETKPRVTRVAAARRPVPSLAVLIGAVMAVVTALPAAARGPHPLPPLSEPATPCSVDWLADGQRWHGAVVDAVLAAPLTVPGPAAVDQAPSPGPRPLSQPAAESAHPSSAAPPNDELYWAGQFNSLPLIGALDAWETSYGGDDVTIAVIGDGVDYGHPDLAAKIWRNAGEVPGNGLDDDGNGYADDVRGWDFGEGDADPGPIGSRGTMLAGIAAAETNNRIGIAGVDWNARIMPLKVHKAYMVDGSAVVGAYPEDFTRAVCYAANNRARVILFSSFNLQGVDSAAADLERLRVAIEYAYQHGSLTVAPAGDCGVAKSWCPDPATYGENPPMYPAVFNNVVGVQAFRPGYQLRETASHGPWVDIAAPGEGLYTTKPTTPGGGESYHYINPNTAVISDFAAAHAAGLVALMMSVNPGFPLLRIQQKLCEAADRTYGGPYEDGRNDAFGCGVLDMETAVERMPWKIRVTPDKVTDLTDGQTPWPDQEYVNPYLNAIAWEIRPEVAWLRTQPVKGRAGGPSIARVTVEVASIPDGMLQAGMVHTETLHACTVGNALEECQTILYGLRRVDRVWQLLLPFTVTGFVDLTP